ncbi:PIG-L family deacetylase [Streptomyces sp. HNM0574]|uniref:PIG-L deacetylase family protein n=1 Tax=Streptomyces sp. HNM0574 TaxID=2714954 RepID=UPI00146F712F|nr:PIG-L family deacetylase [Streptomyces sp. HNM0574]NLU68239.1 hypothetical protein [Streptomyces sp. HNM0574]
MARHGLTVDLSHPDDEVIGPGGTLARHAAARHEVHVLILAEGKTSRGPETADAQGELSRGETAAACAALGVTGHGRLDPARHLGDEVARTEPRIVCTHHTGDLNADHELTTRATAIACRWHVSTVRWLLGFSTLSSTEAGFGARPGPHSSDGLLSRRGVRGHVRAALVVARPGAQPAAAPPLPPHLASRSGEGPRRRLRGRAELAHAGAGRLRGGHRARRLPDRARLPVRQADRGGGPGVGGYRGIPAKIMRCPRAVSTYSRTRWISSSRNSKTKQ